VFRELIPVKDSYLLRSRKNVAQLSQSPQTVAIPGFFGVTHFYSSGTSGTLSPPFVLVVPHFVPHPIFMCHSFSRLFSVSLLSYF
jgi:hypothetical protein